MCVACIEQLQHPWQQNKDFYDQPRYKSNNLHCVLWTVLGNLNNWRKIAITDNCSSSALISSRVTRNVFKETLQDRAFAMSSIIEPGKMGAIATTDASAPSGYYVFSFTSGGYVLQDLIRNKYEKIPKGEYVCDITWLNPVPNCSRMYTHGYKDDASLNTTIRIQHIVENDVKFSLLSSRDMLPKTLRPMFETLISKSTII